MNGGHCYQTKICTLTAVVSKINVASCSTLRPGCLATTQPGAWNAPTSCLLYAVPLQSCDSTEGRIMMTCPFLASVRFHPHLTANADCRIFIFFKVRERIWGKPKCSSHHSLKNRQKRTYFYNLFFSIFSSFFRPLLSDFKQLLPRCAQPKRSLCKISRENKKQKYVVPV